MVVVSISEQGQASAPEVVNLDDVSSRSSAMPPTLCAPLTVTEYSVAGSSGGRRHEGDASSRSVSLPTFPATDLTVADALHDDVAVSGLDRPSKVTVT